MSHSKLDPIIELPEVESNKTTLAEMLEIAREKLGPKAVLEFQGEIVVAMQCPECGNEEPIFQKMARLYESKAVCPQCGARREMLLTHRIDGKEDFLQRTLAEFDIPALDIIRARNEDKSIYLELTGDKESFLNFQ